MISADICSWPVLPWLPPAHRTGALLVSYRSFSLQEVLPFGIYGCSSADPGNIMGLAKLLTEPGHLLAEKTWICPATTFHPAVDPQALYSPRLLRFQLHRLQKHHLAPCPRYPPRFAPCHRCARCHFSRLNVFLLLFFPYILFAFPFWLVVTRKYPRFPSVNAPKNTSKTQAPWDTSTPPQPLPVPWSLPARRRASSSWTRFSWNKCTGGMASLQLSGRPCSSCSDAMTPS